VCGLFQQNGRTKGVHISPCAWSEFLWQPYILFRRGAAMRNAM
jgi:hypothetical protein